MTGYDKLSGFSDEISADVTEQFTVLNDLHVHYFEPRGIDGKNISSLSDEEVATLKEKMERCGIRVSSIGSPIGKVKLSDPFAEHFSQFVRVVEIAKQLDAKYIRIFSFYHEGGSEWSETERQEVLARLGRMIEYAAKEDVILLHENEKDIYGDTAARCLDLMQSLYGPHFQAVFDPANFVQCRQDTLQAYTLLKDYIAYFHIKDARWEDGHVVPAGVGDGHLREILREAFGCGYHGYLSLEPHLGSFAGLSDLELGDKMTDLPEGGAGTFTLAYRALIDILAEI